MNPLILMPVLDITAAERSLDTMCADLLDQMLVVNNTDEEWAPTRVRSWWPEPHTHPRDVLPRRNIGVARTFNHGARMLLDDPELTHVGWVSTSMRWNEPGGSDFLRAIGDHPMGVVGLPMGLHAFAIGRPFINAVGLMDENFGLGYHEDTEYLYRGAISGCHLAAVHLNGSCIRDGQGYDVLRSRNPGRQVVNFDAQVAYYSRKWGGPPGSETFTHPFGDATLDVSYCPPVTLEQVIELHGLGL